MIAVFWEACVSYDTAVRMSDSISISYYTGIMVDKLGVIHCYSGSACS